MASERTRSLLRCLLLATIGLSADWAAGGTPPGEGRDFPSFVWPSQPPADCPFEHSKDIVGVVFTGVHSDYHVADTWYPSWASDGNLYSPWTDGSAPRADGTRENSNSGVGPDATTGQAVLIGDDLARAVVGELEPHPAGAVGLGLGQRLRPVVRGEGDVHAAARERVQVRRQGCDERLTLTRSHLGDAALMQGDTADR